MKFAVVSRLQRFWNQFSAREQRQLTVAFLVIVSASTLILGFLQVRHLLNRPFYYFTQVDVNSYIQPPTEEEDQLGQVVESQNKDSDEDGLSDYEELYVYSTSPYIGDTDSDGFTDKQEVESSHNPNCPASENCLGGTTEAASELDSAILTDPDDLRVALMNYGYSQEQVAAMSDEQLRAAYVAIITSEQPIAEPSQADQLRSAILQAGIVDEETLNNLSDEEIVQIYNETIGGGGATPETSSTVP